MATVQRAGVPLARPTATRSDATGPAAGRSRRADWLLGLALALVISAVYLFHFIDRGWIPHDEGTLAQSAERVLSGELPHRDFIEGYTGGLTYLHALAFKVFGVHLLAIRYTLFVAAVAWVVVFYQVAARIVSPLAAAAVTLIAVFWSVPNYPAGMPSWYNLFLATGGLAVLLRYIDSGHRRWLFTAGFLGGLSILMKIHGLLFVAAGLLFLLFHESEKAACAADEERSGIGASLVPGAVLLTAVLALLVIGLSRGWWVDMYQFAFPGLSMVAIVAWGMFRGGRPSRAVAKSMFRAVLPYLIGTAVPVAVFAAHYAAAGALSELAYDFLLLPAKTREGASLVPPVPLGLIPFALAAFTVVRLEGRAAPFAILQHALGIAIIPLMLVPKSAQALEVVVWTSLAGATPVIILVLAFLTYRDHHNSGNGKARSQAVLIGCVAAFCSLVQFPWAAPIYFSYSLPLLVLAVLVVVRDLSGIRIRAMQGLTVVYLLFGALYITPMNLPGLRGPVVPDETAVLELPRGGLRVGPTDAQTYPAMLRLLRTHAPSGVIFAGPDAPEVYFLGALRNPTPALFDYLVPDTLFHEHVLQRVDSMGVTAVALRERVVHSLPLTPEILTAFAAKFPFSSRMGNFTVRWR